MYVLLFLISLVCLMVGLIKPEKVIGEKMASTPGARKKAALIYGLATLAFFILIVVTAEPTPAKTEKAVTKPLQVETQKEEVPKNIVTEVVDGDTIKVETDGKQETIRLIGLDTPETKDPRKSVQCFGEEASKKLTEMVNGKEVRLESDNTQGDKDKYDRSLRYVYLTDNTFVNKEMILQGYGFEYTYDVPYKYQVDFKASQKEAEDAGRGLWAAEACVVAQTSAHPSTNAVESTTTTEQATTPSTQTSAPAATTTTQEPAAETSSNLPLKAICKDGSVSYQDDPSKPDYRGMCSGHGGIQTKLGRVP